MANEIKKIKVDSIDYDIVPDKVKVDSGSSSIVTEGGAYNATTNKLVTENDASSIVASVIESKTGTITPNVSPQGTSSGTIDAGAQIKIGKGYYSSDKYYQAEAQTTLTGNATASQVLKDKTFYSNSYTKQTGTMPNNGATGGTITSQNGTYTIPAGYTSGGTVEASLPNATFEVTGPDVNSVTGGYVPANTGVGTVASGTMAVKAATPSVTGAWDSTNNRYTVTATAPAPVDNGTQTAGWVSSVSKASGTSGTLNIAKATFEVSGASVKTTSSGAGYIPASTTVGTVSSMTLPTSTSSSGSGTSKLSVTPGTSNKYINIPTGYNSAAAYYTVSGSSNLTAANIKNGVSIFGVTGTYSGTTPSGTKYINTVKVGSNTNVSGYAYAQIEDGASLEVDNGYSIVGVENEGMITGFHNDGRLVVNNTGNIEVMQSDSYSSLYMEAYDGDTTLWGYGGHMDLYPQGATVDVRDGEIVLSGNIRLEYGEGTISAANLTSANIKSGVSILGVTGTYTGSSPFSTLVSKTQRNVAPNSYSYVSIKAAGLSHGRAALSNSYSSSYDGTATLTNNTSVSCGRIYGLTSTSYKAILTLTGYWTSASTQYIYYGSTSGGTTYSATFTSSSGEHTYIIVFEGLSSSAFYNTVYSL